MLAEAVIIEIDQLLVSSCHPRSICSLTILNHRCYYSVDTFRQSTYRHWSLGAQRSCPNHSRACTSSSHHEQLVGGAQNLAGVDVGARRVDVRVVREEHLERRAFVLSNLQAVLPGLDDMHDLAVLACDAETDRLRWPQSRVNERCALRRR